VWELLTRRLNAWPIPLSQLVVKGLNIYTPNGIDHKGFTIKHVMLVNPEIVEKKKRFIWHWSRLIELLSVSAICAYI
jgi:hypothetical protein